MALDHMAASGGRGAVLVTRYGRNSVNVVAPGPIDTEMWHRNNPPETLITQQITRAIPMGRLGTTHEVAAAVKFFLSAEASFTAGQVLFVCGGLSVGAAGV